MKLPLQKNWDYFYRTAVGLGDKLERRQNLGVQRRNVLDLMSKEIVIFLVLLHFFAKEPQVAQFYFISY